MKKPYNIIMRTPICSAIPLYRQVAEKILHQLADGSLKPGQYLPSEWDLAHRWQISQGTVRKGLSELVAQGILGRQQGVGTYVTHKNTEWGDYPLVESSALLQTTIMPVWPRAEVLSITATPVDDEAAVHLQLRRQTLVWKLAVLWRYGHQSVALDEALLPVSLLPELNIHFVHRRLNMYAFLQLHYGLSVQTTLQFLSLQTLPMQAMRLLKADAHVPAWCWYRLSVTASGMPIEWRRRYVLPGALMLQTSVSEMT